MFNRNNLTREQFIQLSVVTNQMGTKMTVTMPCKIIHTFLTPLLRVKPKQTFFFFFYRTVKIILCKGKWYFLKRCWLMNTTGCNEFNGIFYAMVSDGGWNYSFQIFISKRFLEQFHFSFYLLIMCCFVVAYHIASQLNQSITYYACDKMYKKTVQGVFSHLWCCAYDSTIIELRRIISCLFKQWLCLHGDK